MITYYLTFFTIVLSNFNNIKIAKNTKFFFYTLFSVFLIFFIGFRHEIGTDWGNYLVLLEKFKTYGFSSTDIGYAFYEYIAIKFDLGIYGINTFCAVSFTFSFLYFLKTFNLKLSRALLISFPYLILVVAMGYNRQGVAIGFIMVFFAFLYQKKLLKAFLFLILATLFHKTAIVSAVVIFLNKRYINFKNIVIFLGIVTITIIMLLNQIVSMYVIYFEKEMQSSGAIMRISINIMAVILLLIFAKRWKIIYGKVDFDFWKPFIYMTILMFLMATFLNITTIADRILLYFYPLQIVVFSRMLYLIKDRNLKYIYFLGYILFSFLILFVFLNFGTYSIDWLPYNNLLFL